MTTAFVLSGGGSLGSIQVGMLLALAEAEITPRRDRRHIGRRDEWWLGRIPL